MGENMEETTKGNTKVWIVCFPVHQDLFDRVVCSGLTYNSARKHAWTLGAGAYIAKREG